MAKNLKEAVEKNRVAAEELDRALRDCLAILRSRTDTVVEGRFRVVDAAGSRLRGQA